MKPYLILALIVFAGILPFSSRAIFMDEHIFLKIAENARHNGLFPQDIPSVFFGSPVKNFAAHTHPPVGEYCLALIYTLFGRFSEVPFRLAFSVFSIASVLAFYSLARRFIGQPFLAALVFALSPAFFVMTPTLMMDVPMLAFLLTGLAFYFASLDGRRYALPVAAACFVLAAGTGYTALVVLVCLFVEMLVAHRPRRELMAVVAAPLALVIWQVSITAHFGTIPINETVGYYRSQRGSLLHNSAAILSFLGTLALFPWTSMVVFEGARRKALFLALPAAVVLALAVGPWFGVAAGSGLLLLFEFGYAARRITQTRPLRGELLFVLWVPATLIFFIVVADMINARYVMLALPALYLVILRHTTRRRLVLALIPTAMLALSLAYADFSFVNSYRTWVQNTVIPLQKSGFRVWSAAESGLRFYLERQGIEVLTASDLRPAGTDLVVQHDLFRYGLSDDVATMLTPLRRFTLTSTFPLRTFNREAGAGFHDSNIGLVPFTLSTAPLDYVEISEMSPFVASLPLHGVPAEDVPAWSPNGVILKQSVDRRDFKMKIPANSKLEYELDGQGAAEATADGIILRRSSPGTIVWRNVRLVPF